MFAPVPPRRIDAIQAPEYRPALRVGSAPIGPMIIPPVFPWRQGTADRDVTTRLKFSQPVRLRLHDRIQNGHIQIAKDAAVAVYLFPDHATTLEQLRQLQADPATRVSFITQMRERPARQD